MKTDEPQEPRVEILKSILDSSVWGLGLKTKVVWVTMLAMADEYGRVPASIDGIARRADEKITVADVERALKTFQALDHHSRDPAHDGVRVRREGRFWRILNYTKINGIPSAEKKKVRQREWARNKRKKINRTPDNVDAVDVSSVDTRRHASTRVDKPVRSNDHDNQVVRSSNTIPAALRKDLKETPRGSREIGLDEGECEGEKEGKEGRGGIPMEHPLADDEFILTPPERTPIKPTEPPVFFTRRQEAFFYALRKAEFVVSRQGVMTAWAAVKDPVRLARSLGDEDAYPAVDPGAIARASAWSLANPKKAKVDIGRFITVWVAREQEKGGSRGVQQNTPSPSGRPIRPEEDLETKMMNMRKKT